MMGKAVQYIKTRGSIISLFILWLLFFTVWGCARMSTPGGGPKDEAQPIPLKSKPINYATNFKGEKITILFDEYVVLNNINQELLVSPPLAEKPEIKQRGKNLIIKINNILADSTTYNFNFYNSIADLTEGNALKNFQFEFSTGPVFDSIYLGGIMHNAFDYTTQPGNYVLLYESFNDTIPRTTLPNYVAKTDESGNFFVTNLKSKPYYIFGLNDMNNNMLFDLPNEGIAFTDSIFIPGFIEQIEIDTISVIKSISPDLKDTVRMDTIIIHKNMVTTIGNIRLFLFTEDFEKQYLKQSYRPEKKQIIVSFNRPLTDSFSVVPLLDTLYNPLWYINEPLAKNDSVVYWLTDSVMYNRDSLRFQVNYTMLDSNLNTYIKIDTLELVFKDKITDTKKEPSKKKGLGIIDFLTDDKSTEKPDTVIPPSELTFTHNFKSPFDLNIPASITARFPLKHIDAQRILFNKIEDDTVKIPVVFNLKNSETEFRGLLIEFDKDEEEIFEVKIPAGTFTDIYDQINDSLSFKFKTQSLDYYSTIFMKFTSVKEPAIVYLLDEKEKIIETRTIAGDTTLYYDYLPPKKYKFKLFYDSNNNGKWDTGNLKQKLQPERVFYYPLMPEVLETKSNIDIENTWNLSREFETETMPHINTFNKVDLHTH